MIISQIIKGYGSAISRRLLIPCATAKKGKKMNSFRNLRDTNGMAKRRLEQIRNRSRYYSMEKADVDKTNFKRPPYYMETRKNSQ